MRRTKLARKKNKMASFGVTTSWRYLVFVLLVLHAQASESRQIDSDHGDRPMIMSNEDKETQLRSWFFNINDMKPGKRRVIQFLRKERSIRSPFIPRAEADSIPFSQKELPETLRLLNVDKQSTLSSIKFTVKSCERAPASEVFKACFTSFESMLESVQRFFGISDPSDLPAMMTSVFHGDHKRSFQNYTVLGHPEEVATPKMMGCHAMPYPYAIFLCHVQPGVTKVIKIPLVTDYGVKVDAVGACHFDTSQWDADNRAFLALGLKPGDPVCHFFPPYDNFAWVHTSAPTKSSI